MSCAGARSVTDFVRYDRETGQFYIAATGEPVRSHVTNGYLRVSLGVYGMHYAHRLAWLCVTGEQPRGYIDHADGNPLNNAWSNLRSATPSQNAANSCRAKNNTTGAKGVTRYLGKYRAQICVRGERRWLGDFDTLDAAREAYASAARSSFGKFARAA